MATAITCDSQDGMPAVVMLTIVANGDVSAFCARCAPEILMAIGGTMAAAMTEPEPGDGGDDSGRVEDEPEDRIDLEPEPDSEPGVIAADEAAPAKTRAKARGSRTPRATASR